MGAPIVDRSMFCSPFAPTRAHRRPGTIVTPGTIAVSACSSRRTNPAPTAAPAGEFKPGMPTRRRSRCPPCRNGCSNGLRPAAWCAGRRATPRSSSRWCDPPPTVPRRSTARSPAGSRPAGRSRSASSARSPDIAPREPQTAFSSRMLVAPIFRSSKSPNSSPLSFPLGRSLRCTSSSLAMSKDFTMVTSSVRRMHLPFSQTLSFSAAERRTCGWRCDCGVIGCSSRSSGASGPAALC